MPIADRPETAAPVMVAGVPLLRLQAFARREAKRYARARPLAAKMHAEGSSHFLHRVPMHWMRDWPMPHLPLITKAKGARITDIDGFEIDDFCLGDTGSMFGHSPAPVAKAIRRQAKRGLTYMLPSREALRVGALLSQAFGPMQWQIALSASDANRYALRVARAVTGRRKVLVFDGSYHGTVDDVMVECDDAGQTRNRQGLVGQVQDLTSGAVACDFNDLAAVEAALQSGEIAAILTEPVMTNCCMVLPEDGFLQGLRDLASRYGALLMIDETHTQSSGLGGHARLHRIAADILIVGKCIAGGMPTAVWGLSDAVAARFAAYDAARPAGHSGMGTTLSANPMQMACLQATLSMVMTAKNFAKMDKGAERLATGLSEAISRHKAPWHVVRIGARVEFICAPTALRNGREARAAHQPQLEAALHIALLNRGALIAPFHNMMLVSPATKKRQIDRLIAAFDDVLGRLFV